MLKDVQVVRMYTLKYLGVKEHDVSDLLVYNSEKHYALPHRAGTHTSMYEGREGGLIE